MKKDDITMCLGVTTCDKCSKVMKKDESIIVIAEGPVTRLNNDLDFKLNGVQFACHYDCWDGLAEIE